MEQISIGEFEITHFEPEDITREQLEDLSRRLTTLQVKITGLMWDQAFLKKDYDKLRYPKG